MHPILFHIGSKAFPTYGFFYAAAVIMGLLLSYRRALIEGINPQKFLQGIVVALLGMMLMSKLFHVMVSWDWYMKDPKRFFDFRTGHVFYGGYIGTIFFPLFYFRLVKQPFLPILDICATYMPLSLALHRSCACFGAGCCYGKPTELPWGVVFPFDAPASKLYGQVAVHPTQLYEALFGLALFGFLLYWRKHHKKTAGEIFTWQVVLYAIWRFLIEFVRGDVSRGFYGPFSSSQWVSIGMLVLAGALAAYIIRQRKLIAASAN